MKTVFWDRSGHLEKGSLLRKGWAPGRSQSSRERGWAPGRSQSPRERGLAPGERGTLLEGGRYMEGGTLLVVHLEGSTRGYTTISKSIHNLQPFNPYINPLLSTIHNIMTRTYLYLQHFLSLLAGLVVLAPLLAQLVQLAQAGLVIEYI